MTIVIDRSGFSPTLERKGSRPSNPRYVCFAREDYRIITRNESSVWEKRSWSRVSRTRKQDLKLRTLDWFYSSHDHMSGTTELRPNEWILDLRLVEHLAFLMIKRMVLV